MREVRIWAQGCVGTRVGIWVLAFYRVDLLEYIVISLLICSGSTEVWTVECNSHDLHLTLWLIRLAIGAIYTETAHDGCPVNEILPIRLQEWRLRGEI